MALQRNRGYSLTIGNYKTGEGILIEDLQVTFDISKSSSNKDKTNSAAIEIYNLSDEDLKLIDTDYPTAVFSAGYHDTFIKELFSGQVINVTTREQGTDRVTQIQMGSGYTELNHDVLSQLTAPGKTVKDTFEDIRKAIPNISRGVYNGTNLNNQLIYGYPLMGTPKDMLDELSEKFDVDWQLDGDVLYVHDNDRASTENFGQAYLLRYDTGLIDMAYRTTGDVRRSKKDKVKKQSINCKILLNGDIVAGSIVKLEQDSPLDGFLKVDSLRHTGDYRGQAWYTELKCSALEKVVRS